MRSQQKINLFITVFILTTMALSFTHVQPSRAAPPGGSTPTIWVTDPGDAPDADGVAPCDTGAGLLPTGRPHCTLRAAIQIANAQISADVIAFEMCGEDFAPNVDGSYTIAPASPLPALAGNLTYINGYTQGYPQNTAPYPTGYDDPGIVGTCTTTLISRPNSHWDDSMPGRFGEQINTLLAISVDGASCITPVPENDPDQTTPVSGGVVPSGSIIRWNGSAGACSGFTVTSDRNVFTGLNISNWRNAGILIMPLASSTTNKPSENTIWGNFIGTDRNGLVSNANRFGVEIIGQSHSNYIGDTLAIPTWSVADARWTEEWTSNERNLISGNNNVFRVYGYTCAQPGTPATFLDDGAGVFIGVDPCIRQNGNRQSATFLGGSADNHIRNSYIGTNIYGDGPIANSNGIWMNYDAGRDTIVDPTSINYPGNHIGGCVSFPFSVGTLPGGCDPQSRDEQQDPNLISGNQRLIGGLQRQLGGHGIWLNGQTTSALIVGLNDVDYNEIGGNFIGTDRTGLMELPNHGDGVYILANQNAQSAGPDHNEIGATTEYLPITVPYLSPYTAPSYRYGNLISANGDIDDYDTNLGNWDNGIEVRGIGANDNRIGYGNTIGLNSAGDKTPNDLGNGDNGVLIWYAAAFNYVHNNSGARISSPYQPATLDQTSTFGAISDNGDFLTALGREGVQISAEAHHNHVFRNCIGGDAVDSPGGNADDCDGVIFGNHFSGVYINNLSYSNWVGLYNYTGNAALDNQHNWIHHNNTDGVDIVDDGTYGSMIRFNAIWRNGDPGDVPVDGNLGIDLGNDDDTANDGGDADTGPNNYQNYPVNRLQVYPWLISFDQPTPCASCIIDIYATLVSESDWTNNPNTSDPQVTNNGEGRYWLRSVVGNASNLDISADIATAFGGVPPENVCITLTSTNPADNYNTSEFTPCMGFTPTAVTLTSVRAHSGGTLSVLALAWFGVLAVSAAGVFIWRRRK